MEAEKKRLKIYCETSFWSYLNGRPTTLTDIVAKQEATRQWWRDIAPKCEIYISPFVDDEAEDGNPERAALRIKSMEGRVSFPKTAAVIIKAGFNCPVIITPSEFLERREEFDL